MTVYRQIANPNATNSELDAKRIVKHRTLNPTELQILKNAYCNTILECMDYKHLETFVYNALQDDYSKYTQLEMKTEIECSFDDETYRDMLHNIGESESQVDL